MGVTHYFSSIYNRGEMGITLNKKENKMSVNTYAAKFYSILKTSKGEKLNSCELERIIRDEISRHGEDGIIDEVQNDWEICSQTDQNSSWFTDQERENMYTLPVFGAICYAGIIGQMAKVDVDRARSNGRTELADFLENQVIDHIFYYVSCLVDVIEYMGVPNEQAARRIARFTYGHEHRHAHQTTDMISTANRELTREIVASGDMDTEQLTDYSNALLEVDADRAGLEFLFMFED